MTIHKERLKAFTLATFALIASTDDWDDETFELFEALFNHDPRWEDLWNALTALTDDD